VRGWVLYDRIFPRLKTEILSTSGRDAVGGIKAAIAEFERIISECRKKNWQEWEHGAASC
jgi:hypothetical protein